MNGREVITARIVVAKRKQVFAAWTDPAILAQWWGPKGFSNTFHTFDLKPEGLWDFTMHGPDGADYNNTCVFKRIEPPGYLEFDHLKEMHFYKAIVTFTEVQGGTRIEWTMRFNTAEELAPIRPFIERANEENLDKLESLLYKRHDAPQRILQPMKRINIAYWIITALFSAFMIFSSVGGIMLMPEAVDMLHDHLGYPLYFIRWISAFKMIGAVAILLPFISARVKEWAYFGFFIDLATAVYSFIALGDPIASWAPMLVFIALLFLVYRLHHKRLVAATN